MKKPIDFDVQMMQDILIYGDTGLKIDQDARGIYYCTPSTCLGPSRKVYVPKEWTEKVVADLLKQVKR